MPTVAGDTVLTPRLRMLASDIGVCGQVDQWARSRVWPLLRPGLGRQPERNPALGQLLFQVKNSGPF
jgi:hypothetical protein